MSDVYHNQSIDAKLEGEEIVIEPPEVNGVRGFEVRMTPQRAQELGHKLIGLSTRAIPAPGRKMADIG